MSTNALSASGGTPFTSPLFYDQAAADAAAAQRRALAEAQRAAAAAEAAARAAVAAAAAARAKAEASRKAAEAAEATARQKAATQADKDAAVKARTQASADEADAEKKESAADLASKTATLKDAQRDDLVAGRKPGDPSAATIKAQADVDAATREDAIVNPPAGTPDALAAAQADTAAKFKALVAATNAGDGTPALKAKLAQAQGDWTQSLQNQFRIAALDAGAKGKDPAAAVQAQVQQVTDCVDKDGTFDARAIRDQVLQPGADEVKAESPQLQRLTLETQGEQADGDKQVADALSTVADLKTKADAADAAAAPPTTIPYLPGKGPQAPSIFAPPATAAATTVPAAGTPSAQQKAIDAHAALDAAQARADSLVAIYGQPNADDPSQSKVGTLQAGFEAQSSTIAATQAHDAYLKVLGDPASTPDQVAKANKAWQAATDQQLLAGKFQAWVDASAKLVQAKQGQAAAQAAANKLNQPFLFSISADPSGANGLLVPSDGDTRFAPAANPLLASAPGRSAQHVMTLGEANAALDKATKAESSTGTDYAQAVDDQFGGQNKKGLDITGELGKAGDYQAALAKAKSDLTTAQDTFKAAQDGHPGLPSLADARVQLGIAQEVVNLAQAQVAKVNAMQALRDAQLKDTSASGQPQNLDALMAEVRKDSKTVSDLQGAPALGADKENTLVTQTIPAQTTALQALDKRVQAARAATGYKQLLNQYNWLADKLEQEKNQVALTDAQHGALAAQFEYQQSARPTGIDLKSRDHSDAADSALTWSIVPGTDGQPSNAGLPSNIKPGDIKVHKDGDGWYVTFDKNSGAYAQRVTASGRVAITTYVDGSKAGDIAIEKGHRYKLNADAAQYWEAANTDPDRGPSALVKAQSALAASNAKVGKEPEIDDQGNPVLGPDKQLSTSQPVLGPDGKPMPNIDFNVDQADAKKAADADATATENAFQKAQAAAQASPADPTLKAAADQAKAARDLATFRQKAVTAVFNWQHANFMRQDYDASVRAGLAAPGADRTIDGKTLQESADELYADAKSQVSAWRSKQQSVATASAKATLATAQKDYDAWRASHAYLSQQSADESAPGLALQAAKDGVANATRVQAAVATQTAQDKAQAFTVANLPPGQESDPHALYKLFMQDPKTMAQAIIDQEYVQYGGGPRPISSRDDLTKMVSDELCTQPDVTRKIVDTIASYGGDQAKVTVLPVVYAIDADKDKGGGIIKTAIFKVQSQDDPSQVEYVDEYGEHYDSVDNYRANNNLPVDGVNLAMPEDGNFTLDTDGNVKLFAGDARTETGWQHFKRVSHFDSIVGGVGLIAGVVMEVGSGGILTEVAAPLMVASTSLYFAASSAQSLKNRADHGLSIDPFTDREAGMDWLNLGASLIAVPGLGSSARMGSEMVAAEKAGVSTFDRMAILTNKGSLLTRDGKVVTEGMPIDFVVKGSSRATELSMQAAKWAGHASMADNGEYMAQHWGDMSTADKWEQGGMFLASLGGVRATKATLAKLRPQADVADTAVTTRPPGDTRDPAPHAAGDDGGTPFKAGTGDDRPLTDADGKLPSDGPSAFDPASDHTALDARTPSSSSADPNKPIFSSDWEEYLLPRLAAHPAVQDKLVDILQDEHEQTLPKGKRPRPDDQRRKDQLRKEAEEAVDMLYGDLRKARGQLKDNPAALRRHVLAAWHQLEAEGKPIEVDGFTPVVSARPDVLRIRPAEPPRPSNASEFANAIDRVTAQSHAIAKALRPTPGVKPDDPETPPRITLKVLSPAEFCTQTDRDPRRVLGTTRKNVIFLHTDTDPWQQLLTLVHEGTHALDWLDHRGLARSQTIAYGDLEARAYHHENEFAMAMGLYGKHAPGQLPEAFPLTVMPEMSFPRTRDAHGHVGKVYSHATQPWKPAGAITLDQRVGAPATRGTKVTWRDGDGRPLDPTVALNVVDWSASAAEADGAAASGAATLPLDNASPALRALADHLLSDAPGKAFVLSSDGPGGAIYDGNGAQATKVMDASAQVANEAQSNNGGWVHAVDNGANVQAGDLVAADEIAGSVYVDAHGIATALVVPNAGSASWQKVATNDGVEAGKPRAPAPTRTTLKGRDAIMADLPALVAQYRPGASAAPPPVPPESSAFVAWLRRSVVHGSRARFVVSDVAPADALSGARPLGDASKLTWRGAQAAAKAKGGSWIYRAERPQLPAAKGQPTDWSVVGALHVYGDGSTMPVALANPASDAWTRPGAVKVGTSAAIGATVMAVGTLGGAYMMSRFHLPDPKFDPVSATNVGAAVRTAIKFTRFNGAGRWQTRYRQLQGASNARADFEDKLNRLAALGAGNGNGKDMAAAVADFRTDDGVKNTGKFASTRKPKLNKQLENLGKHADSLGLSQQAQPLLGELGKLTKAKAVFDRKLELHERLAKRLADRPSTRFLAGMEDDKRMAFVSEPGDIRDALEAWQGAAPDQHDSLQQSLAEKVKAMHVAPDLRTVSSKVRKGIDFVQAFSYAGALAYELHYTGSDFAGWQGWAANGGFDGAFAADGVRIIGTRVGDTWMTRKGQPAVSQSKLYKQWLPVVDETLTAVGGAGTAAEAASNLGLLPAAKHEGSLFRRSTRIGVSSMYSIATATTWGESFKRHWADPPLDNLLRRRLFLAMKIGGAVATGGLVASTAVQHFSDAKKKQPGGTPLPSPSDSATPTTGATTAPSTPSTPGPTSSAMPGPGTPTPAATPHASPRSTATARRPTHAQAVAAAGDPRSAALLGLANPAGPASGTPASAALLQLFQMAAARDSQADKAIGPPPDAARLAV